MAVIQQARVSGVSTRRVDDDLVRAMGLGGIGMGGIGKSTVSGPCRDRAGTSTSGWMPSRIGLSEAETFRATFLKSLVRRGLHGIKLVVSDAHEGLEAAIRRVRGASWQRCRVR